MNRTTARLKNRALIVGLLALAALVGMAAMAFAAPAIRADVAAPAGHFQDGCFSTGCHTLAVVTPPSGESSPAVPPVGPGVGRDSDDCSGTLEADDCSDTIEADEIDSVVETEGSDDCANDAAEDALKAKTGGSRVDAESDDCADDAVEDAAAARSSTHETVAAKVTEHTGTHVSKGSRSISKADSSESDSADCSESGD